MELRKKYHKMEGSLLNELRGDSDILRKMGVVGIKWGGGGGVQFLTFS